MRLFKKELKRLRIIKALVRANFPYFGINKKQEITRLFYEISKREDVHPLYILDGVSSSLQRGSAQSPKDYAKTKIFLLERRYPNSFSQGLLFRPYLPKIDLNLRESLNLKKRKFYPKNIFIEKKVWGLYLAKRFRVLFPKSKVYEIPSLKDYHYRHRGSKIEAYNRRRDTVFIVQEKYDFFKKCPCTKGAFGCGYHTFNLGFGCIFECTYCYLQEYTNSPGIILPANIDKFFDRFASYKKPAMRIGTGEFSDSLALDNISGFSVVIAEFFRKQKGVVFEFKTKSASIENLLEVNPVGNIVISWSLNPQSIIDNNEFFSASLKERLEAASRCVNAGYRVGFHFDPVIYFAGWQKDYSRLIDVLFDKINPKDIAWISIGTFRFSPDLKPVIERRFPLNRILDGELLLGFDNKLRYPYTLRYKIYKTMIEIFLRYYEKFKLYLCMEEAMMWKDLNLKMPELI